MDLHLPWKSLNLERESSSCLGGPAVFFIVSKNLNLTSDPVKESDFKSGKSLRKGRCLCVEDESILYFTLQGKRNTTVIVFEGLYRSNLNTLYFIFLYFSLYSGERKEGRSAMCVRQRQE